MQTTGTVLFAAKRRSLAHASMPAKDSHSTAGLLYLAAVRTAGARKNIVKFRLNVGPSAWEVMSYAPQTSQSKVNDCLRLSVCARSEPA